MKKLKMRVLIAAAVLSGLCLTSCRNTDGGEEGKIRNTESNPGYEEGEAENAKGGNPSTGGDSTDLDVGESNLESGSGTRTGSNSGTGSSGGSPHSGH